uniref:VWFA-related domain-containing protein n=1 Tax=Solibacter usitatus (strain Ellin6076) TaxID=234267 RepID=Q01WU3_SOLUE
MLKLIAACALAACAALAQDLAAPRLVTLNLTATDSQGHAVTDLTAADIQITDQSKSAPIVAFRNEALRAPAAAGEISNRPAPAISHAQVILFDLLNLSIAARKPAIDQLVRALENREAADAIYLYLINVEGELSPIRALPDAPSNTRAATPWTRNIRAMLDQAVGPVAVVRPAVARDVMLRIQRSYAALETLAAKLAPMPGRKNILWITFGVPCSVPTTNALPWDCRPNLSKLSDKLDQANVAVDPIEMQSASADLESNVTLQQLVDSTGGKLYLGGDIERAVPDAIESSRATYRVRYACAGNNWDGKVHRIHATSNRKGVTLQAKQSYTAEKTSPPINSQALLQSPFDAADIGLTVTVTPGAQPHSVHLRIGLETQDLLLTQRGDRFAGQLASYVVAYLPDNRLQEYPVLPINLNLTTEQREKMSRDGIHLGQDVTLAENVHQLRLLVVDKVANTAGTLTIPVQ